MCKKILSLCVAFILFSLSLVSLAQYDLREYCQLPENISADGVYVVDLGASDSPDDDTVILSKNVDKVLYPASLTKIAAAVVVLERFSKEELKEKTGMMTQDIYNQCYSAGASTAGLVPGEKMSYFDLLHCLLLPSGADAAIVLANEIMGSVDAFAVLMNQTAESLGAKSTVFTNPHGLHDPRQYTTVNDMYILTDYAINKMENKELFCEITGLKTYTLEATNKQPSRKINTTNPLLKENAEGISGIKSGYTSHAGSNLICRYNKGSFNLICIVMNAEKSRDAAANDTKAIISYVNSGLEHINLSPKTKPLFTKAVLRASKDEVDFYATEDMFRIIPVAQRDQVEVLLPKSFEKIKAPLKANKEIDKVSITLGKINYGEVYVAVNESVSIDLKYYFYDAFIIIACGSGLLLASYIILRLMRRNKRNRRR